MRNSPKQSIGQCVGCVKHCEGEGHDCDAILYKIMAPKPLQFAIKNCCGNRAACVHTYPVDLCIPFSSSPRHQKWAVPVLVENPDNTI